MQPVGNNSIANLAKGIEELQVKPKKDNVKQSCRVVCNDLKTASCLQQLVIIWKCSKEAFTPYNTATFLNRFYKLPSLTGGISSEQKAVLNEVIQHAENQIQKFDVDGLSILSEALGHMHVSNGSLFQALKNELLKDGQAKLKSCTIKCLAMIAKTCSQLDTDKVLLLAITEHLVKVDALLIQAKPEELCYLLHACIFCESVSVQFYQKIDAHIRTSRTLDSFAPWQLAMLAHAISVHEECCQALLTDIATYMLVEKSKTIEVLDAEDLGRIKHAMMKLYKRPHELLTILTQELFKDRITKLMYRSISWLTRCIESYNDLARCPEDVLQRVKSKIVVGSLTSRDLVYAICGFSNAEKPDEKLLVQMKRELFTARKVVCLHSLDFLLVARYVEECLPQIEQHLLSRDRANLEKMTPKQLASLAFRLSQWKQLPRVLLKAIGDAICKKMAICSLQDLAEIAYAMKGLVREDSRRFFSLLDQKLLKQDPSELRRFDARYGLMLAEAMYSSGRDVIPVLAFIENIQLEELSCSELTELAHIFAKASYTNSAFFMRVDGLLCSMFSRQAVWSQNEWHLALLASWSVVRGGYFESKTVGLFLTRLENELQERKIALSRERVVRSLFFLFGDDTVFNDPIDCSGSLELTDAFLEKLLLLYLQCPGEFFSGEVKVLVEETCEARQRRAEDAWEAERTL